MGLPVIRRLLLLAPLLAGCALLPHRQAERRYVDGPFEHDGYTLVCPRIPVAECVTGADEIAAEFRSENPEPLTQIRIDDDPLPLRCWMTDAGERCARGSWPE